jgi:hypothetical protein
VILLPGPNAAAYSDTIVTIEDSIFGANLDGLDWIFQDIKGWSLGGGVESNMTARAGEHGMYDGPTYRRARVISIPGICIAPDRATAEAAADQLASILADGSMGTLTVTNVVGARSAQVRLSGEPQATWTGGLVFTWTLQFTAPDWRRYGAAVTESTSLPGGGGGLAWPIGSYFDFGAPGSLGQVTLSNTGNAPTEPVFTVTPPLAQGFQITYVQTGQRIVYPAAVVDDTVVDCGAGTVFMGSEERTGLLSEDQFFSVPKASDATFQFSTLGAETSASPTSMTASVAPAYP